MIKNNKINNARLNVMWCRLHLVLYVHIICFLLSILKNHTNVNLYVIKVRVSLDLNIELTDCFKQKQKETSQMAHAAPKATD